MQETGLLGLLLRRYNQCCTFCKVLVASADDAADNSI